MKQFPLVLFLSVILPLILPAQTPLTPGLSAGPKGELQTGGLTWQFSCYNENWRLFTPDRFFDATAQIEKNGSDPHPAQLSWQGGFRTAGKEPGFTLQQLIQNHGADGIEANWTLSGLGNGKMNILAVEATLPVSIYQGELLQLDSENHSFPVEVSDNQTLHMKNVRQVKLPVKGGWLVVSGENLLVQILDRRKFQETNYIVRFYLPKDSLSLNLKMTFTPNSSTSLSLAQVVNRGFADEVAGDGKGGWTDQGPENDLRNFSAEDLSTNGIHFEIPSTGNTALVLSRHSERSSLSRAEVEIPSSSRAKKYLYLLHAGAYLTKQPVGKIHFYTASGTRSVDVIRNRDINDWWRPASSENAAVAWSGPNPQSRVGLYISRFALPEEPLQRIEFEAGSNAIWMIAAASFTSIKTPLPHEETFVLYADDQWHPFTDTLDIQPGSILDVSQQNQPEPAGTKGALRVSERGTFYFADAPAERVKLWGTSLNFSANFLNKEQADQLAVLFRRKGYNTVRFHHHDVMLFGGWQQLDYQIDPDQLDRLDYMFYRFKQEGLTISTELYQMRRAYSPEVKKLLGNQYHLFKALVPFSEVAMNDWKQFARDLLGRKNPYTGLTWAEDPALTTVCPVNEDTLWVQLRSSALIQKIAREAFAEKHPGISPEENPALFHRFIAETQIASDLEMKRFLKEELGYQGLVTGNNWKNFDAQTPIRMHYDYVDNHGYWDHPSFPKASFRLPANFSLKSATANFANVPRRLFVSRIQGKPFAVTEYNYSMPNPFRSEGGALMGAYAARQDWDVIFRFGWAHDEKSAVEAQAPSGVSATFDMVSDPVNRLSETFVYYLWLRGDLDAFAEEAVYTVGTEAFDLEKPFETPKDYPTQSSFLGLEKRISSTFTDTPIAENANAEFLSSSNRERYESTTPGGTTILEQQGNFLAETPFSKAIVLQTRSLDPSFVTSFSGGPASVLAAAHDGLPLKESKRILVMHLTDVLSEGMEFDSANRYSYQGGGEKPHLLRSGKASLQLPDNGQGKIKAYAVDNSGKRLEEIPVLQKDGVMQIELNTTPKNADPRMVYEIIRE